MPNRMPIVFTLADTGPKPAPPAALGQRSGAGSGRLVADRSAINWDEIDAASHIGLSAGASAPESLVHEIIDEMRERYDLQLDEDALVEETMSFKLPPILTKQA